MEFLDRGRNSAVNHLWKGSIKKGFALLKTACVTGQQELLLGVRINLATDSFSDGGKFLSLNTAVSQVHLMILESANRIDLCAQSARPMVSKVSLKEEMDRLISVLEASFEITRC